MTKQTPAEIYKDIACAVIVSGLGHPDRWRIGQGDQAADEHAARQIRAAAKTIYKEVSEEMVLLSETQTGLTPLDFKRDRIDC